LFVVAVAPLLQPAAARAQRPAVELKEEPGKVQISVGGRPFATYVYNDDKVGRPYFTQVRAPNGFQVTRNHPPVAGQDDTDHATMHPGIWLAFGDIGGHDTWRNKARVVQDKLVIAKPLYVDRHNFTVHNLYFAKDAKKPFAREETRYNFIHQPNNTMVIAQVKLFPVDNVLTFGDQEEMGLGVRVATPLTVKKGGRVLNSDGKKNEKEVRGTTPKWCEYSGVVDGKRVGVTLLVPIDNIQPTYFHVRDYGLMVANMFGRKTFTGQQPFSPSLKEGSHFPLRYALYVFAVDEKEEPSAAAYKRLQQELDVPQP
jgi:hypothetical protein